MWFKLYNTIKKKVLRRIDNDEGAALIISMFVLTIVFGLTATFALSSVKELSDSLRYSNDTAAFWVAEAAVNRFIEDTTMLDGGNQTLFFGTNFVDLSKDDTDPLVRIVTAEGNAGGYSRTIEIRFPGLPPELFDNTISSGGDFILDGFVAGVQVNGKTRLTGIYDDQGFITTANFEDKMESQDAADTTFLYPDANGNGTANEFDDFVAYNRAFVDPTDPNYTGEYSSDEVVYVQSDDTVNIWPNSSLVDKKIIFVEGQTPGSGDVNIWFDSSWRDGQNVTVVSTGSVNYIQPLQNPVADSQLNTISWDDYNEAAILYSTHSGVTYTASDANYGSIVSLSKTSGNLIANGEISLSLIAVWKEFYYEDPVDAQGLVPPAFQGLISSTPGGYASVPSRWAEL